MTLEEWHLRESDGIEDRQAANQYLPHMDATNATSEPDRLERLRRVYARAQGLFVIVEQRPLPAGVVIAIQDHKGHLTVTGSSQEWLRFLGTFFQLSWRAEGEPEDEVDFTVQH